MTTADIFTSNAHTSRWETFQDQAGRTRERCVAVGIQEPPSGDDPDPVRCQRCQVQRIETNPQHHDPCRRVPRGRVVLRRPGDLARTSDAALAGRRGVLARFRAVECPRSVAKARLKSPRQRRGRRRKTGLATTSIQSHHRSMAKQFRLSDQSIIGFVATSDPDRAKKFYRDTLGLPLVSEEMPFALVFDAHGTMLRVTMVDRKSTRLN